MRQRRRKQSAKGVSHPAPSAPTTPWTLPVGPAPANPAPLPAMKISKAGGDWKVDTARAHQDARDALNAIDWSKKDIVIWVPGTSNHAIHSGFEAAVRASWKNGDVSLSRIEYEATWNMRPSVATGVETLRLVLAGIAAHGGNHKVMLAGESQGAWLIGEAMADPMLKNVVDRAVLLGHPFLAEHQYPDGADPRVLTINHKNDQVAEPVKGNLDIALDAMCSIHTGNVKDFPKLIPAILQNPRHGVLLLGSLVRWGIPKGWVVEPHDYNPDMTRTIEYLRWGTDGPPKSAEVAAPAVSSISPENAAEARKRVVAALSAYSVAA